MSDPRDVLRSAWVQDLEEGDRETELPYELAAFEYMRPRRQPVTGPSAEDLNPTKWLQEVERRRDELAESRLKKQAEEERLQKEKKMLLSKSPPESTLPFNLTGIKLEVLKDQVPKALGGIDVIRTLSCGKVQERLRNLFSNAGVNHI